MNLQCFCKERVKKVQVVSPDESGNLIIRCLEGKGTEQVLIQHKPTRFTVIHFNFIAANRLSVDG